ncbi:MAG: hypothetical protein J6S44_05100, partial [Clostridia bacterium]|nr:hypothetical protein [Clostridia bacterium]
LYSFSVETVSAIKGIRDASGALQAPDSGITAHQARSSFRMELFACAFFAGYDATNESQSFCGRWFLSRKSPVASKWGTQNAIKYLADDTWKVYGFNAPAVLGTSYTKQTAANGVAYTIAYHGVSIEMQMGGGFYGPSAYFVKKEDYTALTSTSYDDYAPVFSLYNGLPADVYAIRVYSMPLTEAERNHNFFIDLMAITGTPLDAYLSLSTAARAVLETALSILPMTSTAKEVESAIANAMATLPQPLDKSSLLYVTDGLTAIFTSLPHLSTGESLGENGGNWFNGLGGESASLVGSGWKKSARGGITIERDLDAFNASSEFGLVLPGSLLPEKDYTVELLANPTGITQRDENGVLSHYVDERSISVSTGIWREYGFGIGPLRALQACCLRPAGIDASLERRWVYNATGGCQALGWQYRRTDMVWADLTIEQVTTLSITYEFVEKKSNYAVYSDQEKLFDLPISEAEYKTPDESGRMFRLMCSVAGTVFAVRVYDRALSEVELAQNHVADLLYYYGLDADVLLKLMEIVPSGTDLFTPYQSLGFELTREEAQKEFDRLTVGIWLSYEGVGLREKGGEALRYYFGLKQDGVNGLLAAGFGLELGVMLNVGKNVLPLLEGNDYDYKIPVFTSKTGRATGFFTDDDTFAVTLLYHNLDKASALSNISARGYVRLLSPDGEEMVFYLDLSEKDFSPSSLFNVCYQMDKNGAAKGTSVQSLVSKAMERSSTLTTVYVQAGAPTGGNGTKDSPFCSFTDGWLKCKEILA